MCSKQSGSKLHIGNKLANLYKHLIKRNDRGGGSPCGGAVMWRGGRSDIPWNQGGFYLEGLDLYWDSFIEFVSGTHEWNLSERSGVIKIKYLAYFWIYSQDCLCGTIYHSSEIRCSERLFFTDVQLRSLVWSTDRLPCSVINIRFSPLTAFCSRRSNLKASRSAK